MSTAVGFQRRDREGGWEGEAGRASERESKRQRKRKAGQQFNTKKAPLSPFMTRPTTAPAVSLHPTLHCSVLGIP